MDLFDKGQLYPSNPNTAFREVLAKELEELEKRIYYYENKLHRSTGDIELDEIERIVYTAALSYLRSEAKSIRRFEEEYDVREESSINLREELLGVSEA